MFPKLRIREQYFVTRDSRGPFSGAARDLICGYQAANEHFFSREAVEMSSSVATRDLGKVLGEAPVNGLDGASVPVSPVFRQLNSVQSFGYLWSSY